MTTEDWLPTESQRITPTFLANSKNESVFTKRQSSISHHWYDQWYFDKAHKDLQALWNVFLTEVFYLNQIMSTKPTKQNMGHSITQLACILSMKGYKG